MKTNTMLLGLLKLCAVLWIIISVFGLAFTFWGLWQGKREFPFFTLVLLVGIILLSQKGVRRFAILFLVVFLISPLFTLRQSQFPFFLLVLLVGIGLSLQRQWARPFVLTILFLCLAFGIFAMFLAYNSTESTDVILMWREAKIVIPKSIFYPLTLSVLTGHILLLLSKPVRFYFLSKAHEPV